MDPELAMVFLSRDVAEASCQHSKGAKERGGKGEIQCARTLSNPSLPLCIYTKWSILLLPGSASVSEYVNT